MRWKWWRGRHWQRLGKRPCQMLVHLYHSGDRTGLPLGPTFRHCIATDCASAEPEAEPVQPCPPFTATCSTHGLKINLFPGLHRAQQQSGFRGDDKCRNSGLNMQVSPGGV